MGAHMDKTKRTFMKENKKHKLPPIQEVLTFLTFMEDEKADNLLIFALVVIFWSFFFGLFLRFSFFPSL